MSGEAPDDGRQRENPDEGRHGDGPGGVRQGEGPDGVQHGDGPGDAARESPARWVMMALGLSAWAVGATAIYQLSLLLPALRSERDLALSTGGLLVGLSNCGLAVGLLGWGIAADRFGERAVMAWGLLLCGLSVVGASLAGNLILLGFFLALVGLTAGSVYAPSARLVMGWFPARQRGLAMSITQTSTPLSAALAAALLPGFADTHGFRAAFVIMGGCCLVVALLVALFVRGAPPRDEEATETAATDGSDGTDRTAKLSAETRQRSALRRMYGVSVLLFLPQITLMTFTVSYLVDAQGWSTSSAGQAMSVALLLTVVTRPIVGHRSDRIGRRLGLMRGIAVVNVAVMAALIVCAAVGTRLGSAVVLLAVTSLITGSGLIATTVAEFAKGERRGRALGVQNTLQNGTGVVAPAVLGGAIGVGGYATGFALIAVGPLLAAFLIPVAAERAAGAAKEAAPRTPPPPADRPRTAP
ncbi:MFS transporter [Streptomyces iconiensis]|uniref:MFS transporter n=1 Tax=Streptomyces iconiensis TaxID=1384038 RepID=A0ABT6ZX28_9ACTN|nr:MFS transporter [Streptomyces iconiensis]MDJ1133621.1 MFS transporter [Streptomyces iconiensis]